LIKCSSDLRYVDTFRRYSRSKSKVVRNRAEFWTIFSLCQILGGGSPESYTHFITPVSRHVAWKKFCEDTLIIPEVIGAHTLNFSQNFKFSRLKFLGTSVPVDVSGYDTDFGHARSTSTGTDIVRLLRTASGTNRK